MDLTGQIGSPENDAGRSEAQTHYGHSLLKSAISSKEQIRTFTNLSAKLHPVPRHDKTRRVDDELHDLTADRARLLFAFRFGSLCLWWALRLCFGQKAAKAGILFAKKVDGFLCYAIVRNVTLFSRAKTVCTHAALHRAEALFISPARRCEALSAFAFHFHGGYHKCNVTIRKGKV